MSPNANATIGNPLSKADLKRIQEALYQCNLGRLRAERATAAGINLDEELLRLEAQKQQLESMLKQYS